MCAAMLIELPWFATEVGRGPAPDRAILGKSQRFAEIRAMTVEILMSRG
jgi:hypothetical protein